MERLEEALAGCDIVMNGRTGACAPRGKRLLAVSHPPPFEGPLFINLGVKRCPQWTPIATLSRLHNDLDAALSVSVEPTTMGNSLGFRPTEIQPAWPRRPCSRSVSPRAWGLPPPCGWGCPTDEAERPERGRRQSTKRSVLVASRTQPAPERHLERTRRQLSLTLGNRLWSGRGRLSAAHAGHCASSNVSSASF